MLSGKKTYIVAFGVALVTGIYQLEFITQEMYFTILGLLNASGFATIRAGIAKGPN